MERFGNFVFLFCGLKTLAFSLAAVASHRRGPFCRLQTLAFSLQPLAFPLGVSDQLPSPIFSNKTFAKVLPRFTMLANLHGLWESVARPNLKHENVVANPARFGGRTI